MPSPEKPQPCSFCEKRAATNTYTRAGRTIEVCATCLDRLEVQEALEYKTLDTIELMKSERYDEALAQVDAFAKANRHRDHDGWMARSIAAERAYILYAAGRYEEALQASEAEAQLGFENITYRWSYGLGKARTLQALGRHREALEAFEEAFSHQEPKFLAHAAYYFDVLVELSEDLGQPVDEKWRRVAEAVAEDFAVEMPVRDSLGESMRALAEMTREMPSKAEREWRATHGGGAGGDAL
ncbi:hypothetical protein [Polyangium jinanense]|uniref:Tetratricopeptide repeat protein n=1 Tax=Polyangium jinanense TaxID=2829994 RepID=A0A9X4AW74_9BACT|nr:hypothetical protein [Polyangium jinanense]MDC3961422.1 hypothetical protein [Polyangium jinanense]MDC3987023.1 hypothetical protein [Polyangium jinanense]